jgi:hypothetical protein
VRANTKQKKGQADEMTWSALAKVLWAFPFYERLLQPRCPARLPATTPNRPKHFHSSSVVPCERELRMLVSRAGGGIVALSYLV